jgi:hypothetical protein
MHPQTVIDGAIAECDRLRKTLRKKSGGQVWSTDERGLSKATALAWFNDHRPKLSTWVTDADLLETDQQFKKILLASDRAAARSTYNVALKEIISLLQDLRQHDSLTSRIGSKPKTTVDSAPDFAPLIPDDKMRKILENRWFECSRCLGADAPLASVVMMGGLLEALLLARINKEADKSKLFTAKTAPKDTSTGKTLQLKEWTLRHYIDVAHEVGWITKSAKDIGEVLRDYRNYIHPFKELSHGVSLTSDDGHLLWEVAKSLSRQIIKSTK